MTYLIIIFLVLFSGIFSGLTLGFFSLNRDDLERKVKLGNKQAKKVYAIRKNGNLLLCTLLIGNVAVNSALSIFLGSINSGVVAGLISTVLIVVFGEIIPQASFSRFALTVGSRLAWLVRIFIFCFYPICAPMAWALDRILGDEIPTVYSKKELMKIIEQHKASKDSDLNATEEKIIKGALSYSSKQVKDIMTPRTEVFALSGDEILTKKILDKIFQKGHSRIPVYQKRLDNVIGILYTKDLILTKINKKISDVARNDSIFVDYNKLLDDLLNAFKKTRHHLFIVLDEFGGVAGIVTIEDVLEEIIGAEILDEFDKHEDLQKQAREKMRKKKMKKV